jgi:hypothetical protein
VTVTLTRRAYLDTGTFGVLRVEPAGFKCLTVERPWRNNERNISCIPIGRYPLTLGTFYHGNDDPADDYPAYEVLDVPGRSLIKIHVANTMDDLAGCIGVGSQWGWLRHKMAVLHSRNTYREFMDAMAGIAHAQLVIQNYEGGRL